MVKELRQSMAAPPQSSVCLSTLHVQFNMNFLSHLPLRNLKLNLVYGLLLRLISQLSDTVQYEVRCCFCFFFTDIALGTFWSPEPNDHQVHRCRHQGSLQFSTALLIFLSPEGYPQPFQKKKHQCSSSTTAIPRGFYQQHLFFFNISNISSKMLKYIFRKQNV